MIIFNYIYQKIRFTLKGFICIYYMKYLSGEEYFLSNIIGSIGLVAMGGSHALHLLKNEYDNKYFNTIYIS